MSQIEIFTSFAAFFSSTNNMVFFNGAAAANTRMLLGAAIYILFFSKYSHLNKWLWLPLDVLVVGGGVFHVV